MELQDHGKIRRMLIPEHWISVKNPDTHTEIVSFCSPDDSAIKLSFYYRGKPVNTNTANNFRSLLKQEAHVLEEHELRSIAVVIREASQPKFFTLKAARTEMLNGVRVLVVEGYWVLSKVDSLGIFVDAEKTGIIIDEIYFLAPREKFANNLPLIQKSLESIEWK